MSNTELYMIVLIVVVVINGIGFTLIGVDKNRAQKGLWRISEKTLFLWAFFGGACGILAGMKRYRHKTKKMLFRIGIPLFCFLHLISLLLISAKLMT